MRSKDDLDLTTLKSMIISMRNNGENGKPMTFQAISDKLNSEYGIEKTRQAIQGLYTRATEDEIKAGENYIIDTEICNIYNLGYNAVQTTEIVNKLGINVSYEKVNRSIKSNVAKLSSLYSESVKIIANNLNSDEESIREKIEYRGVKVVDKMYSRMVYSACILKIQESSKEYIKRAVKVCSDVDLVGLCNASIGLNTKDFK